MTKIRDTSKIGRKPIPISIPNHRIGRPPGSRTKKKLAVPPPEPPPIPPLSEDQEPFVDAWKNGQRAAELDPTTPATYGGMKLGNGSVSLPREDIPRKDLLARTRYTRGPLDKYLKSLDLDGLKTALAQDDSPRAVSFLAALADPTNEETDITILALENRISLQELMQIWRSAKHSEALGALFNGAPTIAAHAVEDAKSTKVCCPRCDGAGIMQVPALDAKTLLPVQTWVRCTNCEGAGSIRKAGDTKSREYVLRATGLIKQDSGTSVTIVNQPSAVESVIDELDRADVVDVFPDRSA